MTANCGWGCGSSDGEARNTEHQLARIGGSVGATRVGVAEAKVVSPQGKSAELFWSLPKDDSAGDVAVVGQVLVFDVHDQSAGET